MNFTSRQTTIAIVALILCNQVLASGCFPPANRSEKPPTSLSNGNPGTEDPVPAGWKKIDADGKFSFYLPREMRDTGISGTESFHREYTSGTMRLSFDYHPTTVLAYAQRERSLGKG